MGEAEPLPGILTFHFTLFVSLQVSGGSPCGATPLANGPRHCGQFWSAEVEAARATQTTSDRIASVTRYIRIRRGQVWVFMAQCHTDKAMAIKASHVLRKAVHATIGYPFYVISLLSADLDVHGWSRTPELSPLGTLALASSFTTTTARPVLIGVI